MGRKPKQLDEGKLIKRYEETGDIAVVAKEMGCSTPTVVSRLKKHGIVIKRKKYYKHVDIDLLIETYEINHNITETAAMLGVSATLVRNRLRENGIPIKKDTGGRKIYFDDDKLIQTYYETGSCAKTAKILKCGKNTVNRKLQSLGVDMQSRQFTPLKDAGADEVFRIYQLLKSEQKTAEYFECRVNSLREYLIRHQETESQNNQISIGQYVSDALEDRDSFEENENLQRTINRYTNGTFTLVSWRRLKLTHVILKCRKCGHIELFTSDEIIYGDAAFCKICRKEENLKQDKREEITQKLVKVIERRAEYRKPKICKECGGVFHSNVSTKLYCSEKCANKNRDRRRGRESDYRARCRHYGVYFNKEVTLDKVYERDKAICKLCGQFVPRFARGWTDDFGPMSPTIDHIIPLSKGGTHDWDNVQLAHAVCNSYKSDHTSEEKINELVNIAVEDINL